MRDGRACHRELVERISTKNLERGTGANDVGVTGLAQREDLAVVGIDLAAIAAHVRVGVFSATCCPRHM